MLNGRSKAWKIFSIYTDKAQNLVGHLAIRDEGVDLISTCDIRVRHLSLCTAILDSTTCVSDPGGTKLVRLCGRLSSIQPAKC